jgi:hypothetical protein
MKVPPGEESHGNPKTLNPISTEAISDTFLTSYQKTCRDHKMLRFTANEVSRSCAMRVLVLWLTVGRWWWVYLDVGGCMPMCARVSGPRPREGLPVHVGVCVHVHARACLLLRASV